MGWKSKVAKKVWGAIKGKGKRRPTITGVKPLSGKTPWYVGASLANARPLGFKKGSKPSNVYNKKK